jgi:hypothetical protein
LFLHGKYEKAAKEFHIKAMTTFAKVKIDLLNSNHFDFDRNGDYSDIETDKYVEGVNNTTRENENK